MLQYLQPHGQLLKSLPGDQNEKGMCACDIDHLTMNRRQMKKFAVADEGNLPAYVLGPHKPLPDLLGRTHLI